MNKIHKLYKTLDGVAMFNLYRHEFFANFVLLKYIPRS